MELDGYRIAIEGESFTAQQIADAISEQTHGAYIAFVTDGGAVSWRRANPDAISTVNFAPSASLRPSRRAIVIPETDRSSVLPLQTPVTPLQASVTAQGRIEFHGSLRCVGCGETVPVVATSDLLIARGRCATCRIQYEARDASVGPCACGEITVMGGRVRTATGDHTLAGCTTSS